MHFLLSPLYVVSCSHVLAFEGQSQQSFRSFTCITLLFLLSSSSFTGPFVPQNLLLLLVPGNRLLPRHGFIIVLASLLLIFEGSRFPPELLLLLSASSCSFLSPPTSPGPSSQDVSHAQVRVSSPLCLLQLLRDCLPALLFCYVICRDQGVQLVVTYLMPFLWYQFQLVNNGRRTRDAPPGPTLTLLPSWFPLPVQISRFSLDLGSFLEL